MGTVDTEDFKGTYLDDDATKQAVFDKVVAFFIKHESFHGECIMQSDDPQIEAAPLLAEIADEILKFNVDLKD